MSVTHKAAMMAYLTKEIAREDIEDSMQRRLTSSTYKTDIGFFRTEEEVAKLSLMGSGISFISSCVVLGLVFYMKLLPQSFADNIVNYLSIAIAIASFSLFAIPFKSPACAFFNVEAEAFSFCVGGANAIASLFLALVLKVSGGGFRLNWIAFAGSAVHFLMIFLIYQSTITLKGLTITPAIVSGVGMLVYYAVHREYLRFSFISCVSGLMLILSVLVLSKSKLLAALTTLPSVAKNTMTNTAAAAGAGSADENDNITSRAFARFYSAEYDFIDSASSRGIADRTNPIFLAESEYGVINETTPLFAAEDNDSDGNRADVMRGMTFVRYTDSSRHGEMLTGSDLRADRGVAYAIMAGICYGAEILLLKYAQLDSANAHNSGSALIDELNYFASQGIWGVVIMPVAAIAVHWLRGSAVRSEYDERMLRLDLNGIWHHVTVAYVPACCAGLLWFSAIILSIKVSPMFTSALSVPLMQIAALLSAFVGTAYFRERVPTFTYVAIISVALGSIFIHS